MPLRRAGVQNESVAAVPSLHLHCFVLGSGAVSVTCAGPADEGSLVLGAEERKTPLRTSHFETCLER